MCQKRVLKEMENGVDWIYVAQESYILDCKHNYSALEDFCPKGHSNNIVV